MPTALALEFSCWLLLLAMERYLSVEKGVGRWIASERFSFIYSNNGLVSV